MNWEFIALMVSAFALGASFVMLFSYVTCFYGLGMMIGLIAGWFGYFLGRADESREH
ncbi:hypothetical protein ACI3E1_07480 [Ligilactobacillus sp. LYQ139]|uniref:hypothetical protein n=1 Tax=Ligilactobacillus sp. LYQ139 TaxID=3378800 RepID=UPI003852897E